MARTNGHYTLIPAYRVNYAEEYEQMRFLLQEMPTNAIAPTRIIGLRHTKIDKTYVWYVLWCLKAAFGRRKFNQRVGVRTWDAGLIMIDAPMLNDKELIVALKWIKKYLLTHTIDPINGPLYVATNCIWHLCHLHQTLRTETERGGNRIPGWDDIKRGMTLDQWV